MADELNVKQIIDQAGSEVTIHLDINLTEDLKAEGLSRDLIRAVQNTRKNAGFNVDDRIHLRLESSSKEINQAISKFKGLIDAETLATGNLAGEGEHTEAAKINGQTVQIHLSRQK
jgi:isoleucyl-tRNA synthetase